MYTQIVEPSHVLLALGFDEERAHSSVRIGIGRMNTLEEIEFAIKELTECVSNLKKIRNSTQFH